MLKGNPDTQSIINVMALHTKGVFKCFQISLNTSMSVRKLIYSQNINKAKLSYVSITREVRIIAMP